MAVGVFLDGSMFLNSSSEMQYAVYETTDLPNIETLGIDCASGDCLMASEASPTS